MPVYLATMVTWFATGIWHGASWNFVMWGIMNGVIILISQNWNRCMRGFISSFSHLDKEKDIRHFRLYFTFS